MSLSRSKFSAGNSTWMAHRHFKGNIFKSKFFIKLDVTFSGLILELVLCTGLPCPSSQGQWRGWRAEKQGSEKGLQMEEMARPLKSWQQGFTYPTFPPEDRWIFSEKMNKNTEGT